MAGSVRDNRTPRSSRRALMAGSVVLVIGLLVTAVIGIVARNTARRDAENRFKESAAQAATAIERRVSSYFDEMQAVGAFVANVPDVSQTGFEGYVEASGIFERLPSLAGVFFLEQVPNDPATFDAFVRRRQAIDPGFQVTEIGPRHTDDTGRYVLTYYVANDPVLSLPIGTDVTPITAVSDAMDVAGARDRGITSSFQNDPLLQEIARTTNYAALERLLQLDFFLGVPVYPGSGTDAETPGEVPFGWVGAPVDNFDDVLASGAAGAPGGLGVSLTVDLSETGVADRTDLSRVATQDSGVGRADQAAFTFERSYTVEGVPFRVQVWSTADADAVPATVPLLLLGGVLGSVLAALVVAQRIRARDQERAFAAEQADRARFQRDIVDSVSTPMVVLDAAGVIVASNPAWATLRDGRLARAAVPDGAARVEAEAQLGEHYLDVLEPHLQSGGEQLADEVGRTLAEADGETRGEAEVAVDWGGRRRWFAVHVTPLSSERGGAVVVHEDVTDRKRSHDELEFKASRDALTGLLNRPAVEQEVAAAVERLRGSGVGLSLLFIDLDGFKEVNDSYGHATGDAVLRAVARRIQAAVRADDRVGRLGGDEFLAVLQGVADPDRANVTADRILTMLDEPIHVGDVQLHVRASVGVATADEADDLTSGTLIDQADRAMYLAKEHGGAQAQRLG